MATNKKITQLDELTPATWADDDVIAIVDISAQETKKIQLSTFRGAVTGVSSLNASTPLTVDSATGDVTISVAINGGGTINAVFDEDNMASNSPTALSTQQSIKAYVDSQIITVDSLSEVLALGNTSGGTNLIVSSGDVLTTNTINETTAASGVTIETVLIKDGLVDDRDVSVDGTKLDTVETSADVTDATNVLAALVGQEVVATGFTGTLDGVLGGGTPAAITGTALTLTTGATVTTVLDEDNMASNSATALATQQSIKAYVDSQVGTVDTLAEILASGNTSGGTNIVVSSGDVITTNTINETTAASGVTIDSLLVKDGGITAAGTSTFAGQTITDLGAVTTADINGGTIDGTVIGGSSAAAGTFTTFTSTGIDDNATSTAITIDSSENVGIGNTAPSYLLDLYKSASTVARVRNTAATGGTPSTTHGEFVIESTDGNMGMEFLGSTTADQRILFSDTAANSGQIVYNHTSNYMALFTATAERLRIDSSGNLGIGTTAPSQKLTIQGTDARIYLIGANTDINMTGTADGQLSLDGNGYGFGIALNSSGANLYTNTASRALIFGTDETERMRITGTGNVGIGTSSPDYQLDVSGTTDPRIILQSTGTASTDDTIFMNRVGGTTATNQIWFGDSGSAATGKLQYDHSNNAMTFHTNGGTERVRIDSSGNLGIGNAAPSYLLDLYKSASTVARVRNTAATGGTPSTTHGEFVIESTDANMGMEFLGSTTADQRILFSDTAANSGQIVYNHTSNYMALSANGSERLRINSSGNCGIGTSFPSQKLTVEGTDARIYLTGANTDINMTGTADGQLSLDGNGFGFGIALNSSGANLYTNTASRDLIFGTDETERMRIDGTGVVRPGADNTQTLGSASYRWSVVYAGTGTINTSDEREKQQIANLDDAERRVAVAIKELVKKYKYNDAVALKGDDARIHVGVIAQEVIAAFEAEGLDATRYALLCHDTWEAEPEETDDEGNVINPGIEAGERYGIRYDELLAFMIAAL